MSPKPLLLTLASTAVLLVTAAVVAGAMTYVTTFGTSMSPAYRAGDLVVLGPSQDYGVGDVVAFRSATLDTVVVHRIIAVEGHEFVLKGDNNAWVDVDRPTRRDMLGKALLRLPAGGHVLRWLSSQWALLAAIALLPLITGATAAHNRRRRRGQPMDIRSPKPASRPGAGFPASSRATAGTTRGVVAALAACVVVGAFAFAQPMERHARVRTAFSHHGEFSYGADVAPSAAYPSGRIETGDPIYLRLAKAVDVRFAYTLASDAPSSLHGTVVLQTAISSPNGWQRTSTLGVPASVHDEGATVSAWLDLGAIHSLVEEVSRTTGTGTGTYAVDVVALVRLEGVVAGQAVEETFAPRLVLQLGALEARPTWNRSDGADGALRPSMQGGVDTVRAVPNRAVVGRLSIEVGRLRSGAVAGALLVAIALVFLRTVGRARRDEAGAIAAQYGGRIITIGGAVRDGPHAVIDVTTMGDLSRLAEQYDCLILHEPDADADRYLFQLDRTVYRYVARRRSTA